MQTCVILILWNTSRIQSYLTKWPEQNLTADSGWDSIRWFKLDYVAVAVSKKRILELRGSLGGPSARPIPRPKKIGSVGSWKPASCQPGLPHLEANFQQKNCWKHFFVCGSKLISGLQILRVNTSCPRNLRHFGNPKKQKFAQKSQILWGKWISGQNVHKSADYWDTQFFLFSQKFHDQSFFQNCKKTEPGTTFLGISLDSAYSIDFKNGLTFENP